MRFTSAGKIPLTPGKVEGIGHPNIILERDYRDVKGWCVRMETVVPINNVDQVQRWQPPDFPRALPPIRYSDMRAVQLLR